MGFFGRTDSKRWWRDGEYIPKNSKWLLESLQGVHGTVESIVKMIEEGEEDTDTPVNRTAMRDQFVEYMKEMFKAYFELVEQHDRLVGASNTLTMDSTELPNQQKSSSPSVNPEIEPEARMQLLKENEIQVANTQYNGLAERLHNVESELSKIKVDLAKKEDLLYISEKLNHQQKSNLESLRQKVELQEKELEQKREEIERIKPRLSELEMQKSNWDNKMSILEEKNKYLNIQKVSHEEKIRNLLKDLSLLKEIKESLEKEVELQEKELEQKREEIERIKPRLSELEMHKSNWDNKMSVLEEKNKYLNIQKVSHEEKIRNLLKDLSLLKETKESLEKEVKLQEKELEQKREEIERIKPKLSELEMHKSNWDNKMSVLEEKNKYLNIQKVSYEEKISNLLKDLSLLKETKQSLEKEVVLHLRDKENFQQDLSSQISEVSKVNAMHKGELRKYEIEKEIISEKNSVLESALLKANIEFDALKEKVLALEGNIEILTRTINAYLKKNNTLKVSLSNLNTEAKFLKTKSSGKEGKEGILQNLIAEKQTIFAQVHLLEEQMKKLNETIEEAELTHSTSTNEEAQQSTIDTFNVNNEQSNVQKPNSGLITYDFLIRTQSWKELDVFLNKMPIWRKMSDRIESGVGSFKEGLTSTKCRSTNRSSWLNLCVMHFFRFLGPIKYYLVKFIGSIRTVINFYGSFFTARILDSSHSKSKNDPSKIKDGSDVELKEVGQSEIEMQEELQSKREGSKKIAELQQQELKEQDEAEDRVQKFVTSQKVSSS